MTTWYTMKRNGMKSATIREHVADGRAICRMDSGATVQDEALVSSAPELLAAAKLAFAALNASATWTDQTAAAFTALGVAIKKAEGRA